MHLVGFIIRIYHDARSSECEKNVKMSYMLNDWRVWDSVTGLGMVSVLRPHSHGLGLPTQLIQGALSHIIEAVQTQLPSRKQVQNAWGCASSPSYISVARRTINPRYELRCSHGYSRTLLRLLESVFE